MEESDKKIIIKKMKKGYCEHDKRKDYCKTCGGSAFCIHNKQKYRCKDCKGVSVCEHNKPKYDCKECRGNAFCEHEKIKRICKECSGSSLCEHKRQKSQCKECDGASICEHKKRRDRCFECGGTGLCKNCKDVRRNLKYNGHCLRCFIYLFPDTPVCRNYKTKETAVRDFILENFPNFTWTTDKKVADGCSKRRPDLLLDLGYQVIIVEIDEYKHDAYDCSCENKRIMEISQDLDHRPVIFVRFNPDNYTDDNNQKIESCWGTLKTGITTIKAEKKKEWDARLQCLKEQIEYWIIPKNKTEKLVQTVQLYYDGFCSE